MAERTTILTKFYVDEYIQSLPPTDKLLFMYLLANPSCEPTIGIYELSIHSMAFHTGLDKENIEHTLNRFAQSGRIHFVDSWVIVKNHFKNNPLRGNQKLVTGALTRFEKIPWHVKERIVDSSDTLYIPYLDRMHSLYIGLEPVPVPNPSHSQTHTPLPSPSRAASTRGGRAEGSRATPSGGVVLEKNEGNGDQEPGAGNRKPGQKMTFAERHARPVPKGSGANGELTIEDITFS